MENLTPPLLNAVREVQWRLSSGRSMREAMRLYLEAAHTPFAHCLREWWSLKNQGRPSDSQKFKTHYQRAFLNLVERGCAGQPTLEHLRALEDEISKAADAELELHLATLPFKVLIPLLVFQFPAFLILLLGPVLRELTRQMGA